MNTHTLILLIILILLSVYIAFYRYQRKQLQKYESIIMTDFSDKVMKIPALVEVMRLYVVDDKAFESITQLHKDAIIHDYTSIYQLLEHNARIQRDILFLLELSMHIPDLQTYAYFLYIRDFIIEHERKMKSLFSSYNAEVDVWNMFITIKNFTLIGYFFPGSSLAKI